MTRAEGRPGPAPLPLPAGWPIEDYCRWMEHDRRRPASTIRARRLQLARFGRLHGDPWLVDREDVGLYLLPYADETAKTLKGALSGFYAWAALQRVGPGVDPTLGILVRVPCHDPRPCPEDVWRAALRRLEATGDPRDRATALMIRLAAGAGMRRAEIAAAHRDDLEGKSIRIHGKGGKRRAVQLPPLLRAMLHELPPGPMFPNPATGRPLTPDVVGRRIAAQLDGWGAHTLRHAYATSLYAATKDLLLVQRALGHSSPATTQRYIRTGGDWDAVIAAMMDE